MRQYHSIVVRGSTYLSKVVNRLDTTIGKEIYQNKEEMVDILNDCKDSHTLLGRANKDIYNMRSISEKYKLSV